MKNDEPPEMSSEAELFRRAFGAKARDPAEVVDRMIEKDERNGRWATWDFERQMDALWAFPLLLYLGSFIPGIAPAAGIALVIWALGVIAWTPWIIARVAARRPREDVALATALLGYGLLAWPLGMGVGLVWAAAGVGGGLGLAVAFPLVFVPGAAAMILALRARRPPPPSMKYGMLLAGGGLSYAAVAAVLVQFAIRPLALSLQRGAGGDWTLLGLLLTAALTLFTVWPAAALAMAAVRAWRAALTAAAP